MARARAEIDTPFGTFALECTDAGLVRAGTRLERPAGNGATTDAAHHHLDAARRAFEEYLAGLRRTFENLALAPGGTPFQARVWAELCRIPYGTTSTYGDMARRIEQPRAVRAVGLANGSNPIAVFIPCHRVIGADGGLTGYGGGLPMKAWLLRHEGALVV